MAESPLTQLAADLWVKTTPFRGLGVRVSDEITPGTENQVEEARRRPCALKPTCPDVSPGFQSKAQRPREGVQKPHSPRPRGGNPLLANLFSCGPDYTMNYGLR